MCFAVLLFSLKKFYKESTQAIADKGNWKCPSCRKICCCAACRRRKTKEVGKEDGTTGGGGGGSTSLQGGQPTKKKTQKSSNQHDSHHHRNKGYSSHHGLDGDSLMHNSREDEGYPAQHSHRRGDRSLLHSSSGSPRMGGRSGDSPMQHGMSRSYDMVDDHGQRHGDGDDYSSDDGHHSYTDSDGDSGDTSSDGGSDVEPSSLSAHTLGAQHYMHGDDDPSTSLPSSQFTSLLSAHIKSLAHESVRQPNTPFARLYREAQQTKVKKKIKSILIRPDIKKEKKVELIAAILAPLEELTSSTSAASASASGSHTMTTNGAGGINEHHATKMNA